MRTRKRLLSLLLCGALLFSLCPQTASAVSIPKTGAESSGLCEHHTEHNADCGYTEGIEGTPCGYVCEICSTEDVTPSDEAVLDGQAGNDLPMPAAEGDVTYLYCDENGQNWATGTKQRSDYTVVTADDTTWGDDGNDGWYVVNSNVTIGSRVTVTGNVRLILENGAVLTINGGIQVQDDDQDPGNGSANKLTIYAQSNDEAKMGALTATGGQNAAGIGGGISGSGGNITISGGTVNATGGQNAAGIGGGALSSGGNITISGGTVNANGGEEAAGIGGGISGSGGNITIHGGTVNATGGRSSAGIGGGFNSSGGNITIHGGSVNATGGWRGAGIGGGNVGSGGTVTIDGGSVTATGGEDAAGIGGGMSGSGGSFATGTDGDALIVANGGISDKSSQGSWKGIIFDGNTGKVYGDQTLQENLEIPSDKTLTVSTDSTLTVKDGVTLTNNGTITNKGKITNNGTITGSGTLGGEGDLVGSGTVADTIQNNLQKDSAVTVSPSTATYGSTITLTATISKATNALTRAAANQVEFFVGTDSNKQSLGTASVNGNTATLNNVTISGNNWNIGDNTITAEYGGSMGLKPQTGSTRFTIVPASYEITLTGKADSPTQITLNEAVVEPGNTGTTVTYGYNITNEAPANWQTERVFSGLAANTTYYFFAKVEATTNYAETISTGVAITTTATTKPSGGGNGGGNTSSGGGSSSSGGGSTVVDRPDETRPDIPTTGGTKPVTPDSNGNVTINNGPVQSAINMAENDAKKNGNLANGIAVTIPITPRPGQTSFVITMKAQILDTLVRKKVERLDIHIQGVIVESLDTSLLKWLDTTSAGGDVILRVKRVDALSSTEAKAAIGTRPAYDLSLVYLSGGKEMPITNLNGHTVSVLLPYTPAKGEAAGNLCAVYVDDAGKAEWITKSSYDADQKAVIFEAGHFSVYGVGYKNPAPAFTDIHNHWAADNILFAAIRGLLSGTSKTTFEPDLTTTRGMIVTILYRLAGSPDIEDQIWGYPYADVDSTAYYDTAVYWARMNGIVAGYSDELFGPNDTIIREQMAVIMENYAKKLGYDLPKTIQAVTFADNAQISSWAKNAVKAMQQAGILAGKNGNQFDPKGTATRAEVATVLRRFVEIVIDPQATNG